MSALAAVGVAPYAVENVVVGTVAVPLEWMWIGFAATAITNAAEAARNFILMVECWWR
jgi:hypothetical protein